MSFSLFKIRLGTQARLSIYSKRSREETWNDDAPEEVRGSTRKGLPMNNECSLYILLTRLRCHRFTLLPPSFSSCAASVHACYLKSHQGKRMKRLQWSRTDADSSHLLACDWVYTHDTTLHRVRQWYRGLSYFIQMFLPVGLLEIGLQFLSMQINTKR